MPAMTREEFRAELTKLYVELENEIKFERGADITHPVKTIERWKRIVFALKEDEFLWR